LTSPDPNSIYLLFEGPWLFSNVPGSNGKETPGVMQATAILDEHILLAGRWNGTQIADDNGNQPPLSPKAGEKWTGTLADMSAPAQLFTDVVGAGFGENSQSPAPYMTGFTVNPVLSTDIAIKLPVPNYVMVGGLLNQSNIALSGVSKYRLYASTIFKYTANNGTLPILTLTNGTASFELRAANDSDSKPQKKQHFIFGLHPTTCMTPTEESAHVTKVFGWILSRLSPAPSNVQYAISGTKFDDPDPSTVDGISNVELGLGSRTAPCPTEAVANHKMKMKDDGIQEWIQDVGYSNCAGGGLGVGCCN
jgi:hypothetical protein